MPRESWSRGNSREEGRSKWEAGEFVSLTSWMRPAVAHWSTRWHSDHVNCVGERSDNLITKYVGSFLDSLIKQRRHVQLCTVATDSKTSTPFLRTFSKQIRGRYTWKAVCWWRSELIEWLETLWLGFVTVNLAIESQGDTSASTVLFLLKFTSYVVAYKPL